MNYLGQRVQIFKDEPNKYGVVERIDNTLADTVYLVRLFGSEGYQWYDWTEIEIDDRRVRERRTSYVYDKEKNGHDEYRKQYERRGKKTLAQLRLFMGSFEVQSRPIPISERAEAIYKFMNGE